MGNARAVIEAVVVVFSLGLVVGYNCWILLLRGKGLKPRKKYHDFFAAGKLARSIWARASAAEEKEAILAVQTARNAITASSWTAGIAALLASAGLAIILDQSKTDRMSELANSDPMLKHVAGTQLANPIVILGLALGVLYTSFVCCAQSVRLYVHVGFYIRAVSSEFNPGTLTGTDAALLAIRAGWAFTLGLRLFYLFIPIVMWSIGVTALLVTSVLMTVLLYFMDRFEPGNATAINMAHTLAARSNIHPVDCPACTAAQQGEGGTAASDADGSRRRNHQMTPLEVANLTDVV